MADCYYHGYSGGSGSCAGCDKEATEKLQPGESNYYYEPIPMPVIDAFDKERLSDV